MTIKKTAPVAPPFTKGQPGRPRPRTVPGKARPTVMPSTVPSAPRVTRPGK